MIYFNKYIYIYTHISYIIYIYIIYTHIYTYIHIYIHIYIYIYIYIYTYIYSQCPSKWLPAAQHHGLQLSAPPEATPASPVQVADFAEKTSHIGALIIIIEFFEKGSIRDVYKGSIRVL